ncbi:hypothetical protein HHI36_018295 [Cryptolaemus montrouzieri]|uniref:Metallothionein n=1 Tax=Cryptolaemus montrouzieri TaxID=559131 RepID=A0ABD2P0G1_9CUCU
MSNASKIFYAGHDRCPYPCTCPVTGRQCTDCEECPRQAGEPCSEEAPCDSQRALVCKYLHGDPEGICRGELIN